MGADDRTDFRYDDVLHKLSVLYHFLQLQSLRQSIPMPYDNRLGLQINTLALQLRYQKIKLGTRSPDLGINRQLTFVIRGKHRLYLKGRSDKSLNGGNPASAL